MANTTRRENLLPPLWLISTALLALGIWLVLQLKELAALLVVGYYLAYVMDPWLDWLETKKVGRQAGFFLTLVLTALALVVLTLTAIPTVAREYHNLAGNLPQYMDTARARLEPHLGLLTNLLPAGIMNAAEAGSPGLPKLDAQVVQRVFVALWSALLSGYSLTLTIANLVLLPFFVFYLAVDFDANHKRFLGLFPVRVRRSLRELGEEIDQYVSAYIRGQLSVCFILFLLYALGLRIVGVELWLLIAVIAGFGNMIPYFGTLAGVFFGSLMALVTFGDFASLLATWAVFGVVQALEGTFITPRIVGSKVGLSPLVIILAILAGGSLFGLLGIFLAVPGAAAVKVLLKSLGHWMMEHTA